jgi:predicted nucleic acid-binding protein
MRARALLDTGPLVAFLDRRDRYHRWAMEQWDRIDPPLVTCEAVLSEACFLLRDLPGGAPAVLDLLVRGVLRVGFTVQGEAAAIRRLMGRYATVPMSLADACLVRMVEQHPGSRVLTLDHDFRLYRSHGRRVIPVMMPANR